MARLDINVRGLFATPVAAVELPDAAARNEELRAVILARREAGHAVQASNAGGWHSDRDILSWGGARATEVLAIARDLATRLSADRNGDPVEPAWKMQAWANVNGPGDSNICHYHPGSYWSGTYYIDDGGCASDATLGGEFEMIDPRGAGPGMHAPALRFADPTFRAAGSAETIRPRPGLLFLFPSWLLHQVRPSRGMGLRVSIAFNFGL